MGKLKKLSFYNLVIFAALCFGWVATYASTYSFSSLPAQSGFVVITAYFIAASVCAILVLQKSRIYLAAAAVGTASLLVSWVALLGEVIGIFGWLLLPATIMLACTLLLGIKPPVHAPSKNV